MRTHPIHTAMEVSGDNLIKDNRVPMPWFRCLPDCSDQPGGFSFAKEKRIGEWLAIGCFIFLGLVLSIVLEKPQIVNVNFWATGAPDLINRNIIVGNSCLLVVNVILLLICLPSS